MAELPGFELTALHTPGHTDGHVCFLDRERDLFFSGDHVLAKISPNVGTMTSLLSNPLGAYLQSLRETGEVGIDRGLAAHVEAIPKLRERMAELLELLARGAVAQRVDGPVIRWEAVDGGMLDGQR